MKKRRPNSKCYICNDGFYIIPSRKKADSCCSAKCMGLKKKGKPQKELFKKPHIIKKGNIPWNKGKNTKTFKCQECTREFIGYVKYSPKFCSRWCKHQNSRTAFGSASYGTKHYIIRKKYGIKEMCENCGDTTSKKYEWANISGTYQTIDRIDWARLCCKCHRRYDRGTKNKIEELHLCV